MRRPKSPPSPPPPPTLPLEPAIYPGYRALISSATNKQVVLEEGGAGTYYLHRNLCGGDGSRIAISNPDGTFLHWRGPGGVLGSVVSWAPWDPTRDCWVIKPADCAAQQPGSALLRSVRDGSLLTLALSGDGDVVMRSQAQPVVCWLVEWPQTPITSRCVRACMSQPSCRVSQPTAGAAAEGQPVLPLSCCHRSCCCCCRAAAAAAARPSCRHHPLCYACSPDLEVGFTADLPGVTQATFNQAAYLRLVGGNSAGACCMGSYSLHVLATACVAASQQGAELAASTVLLLQAAASRR